MFCTNCGKQLVDGAYACPYCGNVVENTVQSKPETEQPTVVEQAESNTAEQSSPIVEETAQSPQYDPSAQPEYDAPAAPQAVQAHATSVRTHPLTIIGFVLAFVEPLAGLIISIIAKNKIAKDPSISGNKGLNKAGLIVSIVMLAFTAMVCLFTFFIGIIAGILGANVDPSYYMLVNNIL